MQEDSDLQPRTRLIYQQWCGEELSKHVGQTCRSESTTQAQDACGQRIVSEYRSVFFRHSAIQCVAISPGQTGDCITRTSEDIGKSIEGLFEAWQKVYLVGQRDPEVVRTMKDVITCLEDRGFEKVHPSILFTWQPLESPTETKARRDQLDQDAKDLQARIEEPSKDCAKEHGLFEAQEAAWAAELRRLDKEEPALVANLIREGLLEELEKPGISPHISGDDPDF